MLVDDAQERPAIGETALAEQVYGPVQAQGRTAGGVGRNEDMATLSIPLASILSSVSMTSMPVPVPVSDLAKAACGH